MDKKKQSKQLPIRRKFGLIKLKNLISLLIIFSLFGYMFYTIGKRKITQYLLKRNAVQTKAVIIDEKNNWGNSPVSHEGSYSYQFYVDGKIYKGDSKDSKLQINDSVDIEYVKHWPDLSRPVAAPK
ncbi:hypothetical protein [Chitinophaga nivalis]|uniref:DUF4430 domain-containing protein n=1 Tax=Chitinophaga nivalis TaxID=2991709 RepID=A0ABT3IEJ3_9BACT|nr:hypothetical protein [Chitinophaga nivalis]MCW3467938.1 hypothetical protein [Chitinophaga nivalis]MCW3482371.1 hypothetical protein [Chitinophaga nivalis]